MLENVQANQLLFFDKTTQQIFLNDKRIILMEAGSLGTLRRDLIQALGLNRAKGFLLRYGWDCGVNAARTFKSFLPMGREMDWFYAGPHIHEMTGQVKVELQHLKFNPTTNEYCAEGYWHYSYEAEQHKKHFGVAHHPVCYTLTGFGSGYVSTHLGRRVIFKEVKCIGMGDEYCHWIAKPVEDWGDIIDEELPYYQEENLEMELDKAYRRIEQQKETLKRVLDVNEQLSKSILNEEGMVRILDQASSLLHGTLLLEDLDFQLIHAVGLYQEHCIDEFVKDAQLEKSQALWSETSRLLKRLKEQKRTIQMHVPAAYGWEHTRLVTPIILRRRVQAYLSLIRPSQPFQEIDYILLERVATACALQMMSEQAVFSAERRLNSQLLDALLTGDVHPNLIQRLRLSGYQTNKPCRVFLFP